MAWFTKKQEETPEVLPDIWHVCPACKAHIYKDEWENNLKVCPKCNHHDRLSARERIALLVDPGTFREYGQEILPTDHLGFSDAKGPYAEKAAATVRKTGASESVTTGSGDGPALSPWRAPPSGRPGRRRTISAAFPASTGALSAPPACSCR